MSIAKKLFISLFVLSLLVAATGAVGHLGLRINHSSIYGFVQDDVPVIESLMSTRIILKDLNVQITKRDLQTGDSGVQLGALGSEGQAGILANIERLDEEFERYAKHAGTDDDEVNNLIREMRKTKASVTNHVLNILRMKQLGLPVEEWMKNFARVSNEFILFENQIEQALDHGRWQVWKTRDNVFAQSRFVIVTMGAIAVFSLIASAIVGVVLAHVIIRPIRGLQDGAGRIARGDFSVQLDTASADEIGELAKSFNSMAVSVEKHQKELKNLADDLSRSNEDLEQFAYIASHDLQEPLRKVVSFGQLLEMKYGQNLEGKAKDYIGQMTGAALRMKNLIQALLAYSRMSQKEIVLEQTDLNDVIKEVGENLDARIQDENAELKIGDLPTVKGDRTQLMQLFQNLIGNSLKFRKKDIKPIVEIKCEHLGEDTCRITVQDNGVGFDEQYKAQLFEPFRRLHSRSEFDGTGIGLSLCKKIIFRHGGQISARSDLGKGSVFSIELPRA